MSTYERRFTFGLQCGKPGHGKSYALTRYIAQDWLPYHKGPVYTNLPLRVDALVEYVAERMGLDENGKEEIRRRIVLFPQEHVTEWLEGRGIPKSFFEEYQRQQLEENGWETIEEAYSDGYRGPLAGALVIIDEAGKYWPNTVEDPDRKKLSTALAKWCRTMRHHGAKFIFCAQDELQLSAPIRRLCDLRWDVQAFAMMREGITGTVVGDWLQLIAKFTGTYWAWVRRSEYTQEAGEWHDENNTKVEPLTADIFKLYRSHDLDDGTDGAEERLEWERLNWFQFLAWLLRRNWFNWSLRLVFVLGVVGLFAPPFSGAFRVIGWARKEFESVWRESVGLASGSIGAKEGGTREAKPGVTPAGAMGVGDGPEVERLRAELVAERNLRSGLEARLGAESHIVMVDERGAMFSDGEYWRIGERIEGGRYDGDAIMGVDVLRRRVLLASGVQLVLSRPASVEAATHRDAGAEVAGAVPARGGAGEAKRTASPGNDGEADQHSGG